MTTPNTGTAKTAPLSGIRVLNCGGSWAGRVASLLLAEQGADVIEIQRPGREHAPEDALLGRGKTLVTLDLRDPRAAAQAVQLAWDADIVFDNLGPGRAGRFGMDEARIREGNPGVVHVAIPGFASGSPMADIPAWEGSVAAATGVYTGIHGTGALLGGAPIFTALPMASAYGGVHAAVAAMAGLLRGLDGGTGASFEVPLADAVVSALALQLMEVEGQPQRFDLPPIDRSLSQLALPILRSLHAHLNEPQRSAILAHLAQSTSPQFGPHRCADGRLVFINAIDHLLHAPTGLEAMGLLKQLLAEGMVVGSPYLEDGADNNLCAPATLSPKWLARMRLLMSARFLERPADEWERCFRAAGVPATVVRTTEEWLAWAPAREGGLVIRLQDPFAGSVTQPGRFVSIGGPTCESPPLASRQLASAAAWRSPRIPRRLREGGPPVASGKPLSGLRVLDLSNVIAGPAAARVFAELGADVIRIDPPAPFAGPRMTMWFGIDVNQGKRAVIVDLKTAEGRELLGRLVRSADAVIHNFLDRSASSLGISEAQLKALNPDIVSCQISAWGGPAGGPLKDDPAFDPVLQSATGITARYGSPQAPALHGLASCVDYITGFTAALGVAQALVARKLGRGSTHVRTSLAMGAQLVQFPFVAAGDNLPRPAPQAQGGTPHYRSYRLHDGDAFLACRAADLARLAGQLGVARANEEDLANGLERLQLKDATGRVQSIAGASLVAIRRPEELRAASTLADGAVFDGRCMSFAMVRAVHPSGHRVTLPLPTWYRSPEFAIQPLSAAPMPGHDTRAVLAELGIANHEAQDLLNRGVIGEGWAVLRHYLPR